jgi:hypothetical protein
MESNTAPVSNQPINFPNFSVENKPYKADSFTIRDGRYVGHDGFIVPRDFEEFHERFPHYVHSWVNRHADRTAPKEDLEDWAQDLLIHLQHLPATSKHRFPRHDGDPIYPESQSASSVGKMLSGRREFYAKGVVTLTKLLLEPCSPNLPK